MSMTLGVLLVVGGSGLLRRRGWGRRVCLGWTVLKMVLVIYLATIQYQIAIDQAEVMRNEPGFQSLPGLQCRVRLITAAPTIFPLMIVNRCSTSSDVHRVFIQRA